MTFPRPISLDEAIAHRNASWARNASWIANYCESNTLGDWFSTFWDAEEIPRRRSIRGECRARVARLQVATLLWAYALEQTSDERARRIRACADGLRALSALVGDEHALDYRTRHWHEVLQERMHTLAVSAGGGRAGLEEALEALIAHVRSGHQGRFHFMDSDRSAHDCLAAPEAVSGES